MCVRSYFFFASRTVTDWIQEILLPMSFKWWWFLAFSEILLFGVYGVIWYQPIIDAHQLKNGQKPQLLWIYFELHNGVQKGNRNIFLYNSLFILYWVITTSFYKKLNLHISLCHICREKIENKINYNVFKFLCVWNKI